MCRELKKRFAEPITDQVMRDIIAQFPGQKSLIKDLGEALTSYIPMPSVILLKLAAQAHILEEHPAGGYLSKFRAVLFPYAVTQLTDEGKHHFTTNLALCMENATMRLVNSTVANNAVVDVLKKYKIGIISSCGCSDCIMPIRYKNILLSSNDWRSYERLNASEMSTMPKHVETFQQLLPLAGVEADDLRAYQLVESYMNEQIEMSTKSQLKKQKAVR